MDLDPDALATSLRRLVTREAGSTSERGLLPALHDVTTACVDLFAVNGCGIMLVDEQDALHYVAASDGHGRLLEKVEGSAMQGPCTSSFLHDSVVSTTDVHADERWPRFRAELGEAPHLRAVLGVPVRLGSVPVGTLDVYRDRPHEWGEEETDALARYAEVVRTTLASALAAHTAGEQAAQLQYALDYRVVIERGVGYLMAADGLDAEEAFNRLRSAARRTRTKIGQVAQHLLDTGRLPES